MRLATAACPRWRRRRRWRRSPPGTEEVAAGVGEAPEAGSSISNLALVVPPTVVNNRDAEDPAFLACWRSSSSAASIFGAQNLNLKMAGKEFTVASHNLAQVRSRLRSDPDWGPIQTGESDPDWASRIIEICFLFCCRALQKPLFKESFINFEVNEAMEGLNFAYFPWSLRPFLKCSSSSPSTILQISSPPSLVNLRASGVC